MNNKSGWTAFAVAFIAFIILFIYGKRQEQGIDNKMHHRLAHHYVRLKDGWWVYVLDTNYQIGAFHYHDDAGNFGTALITEVTAISDIPVPNN